MNMITRITGSRVKVQLHSIPHLVALFNSDLLAEYSLDDILKPLVNELKELNAVCLLFGYLHT